MALIHPLGLVSIFVSGYRVDCSVNLALFLLISSFLLIYGCLRAVDSFTQLPRAAKRWRLQQRERHIQECFLNALEQLMTGRYLRSIKSVGQAKELARAFTQLHKETGDAPVHLDQLIALSHLIAAESAHALRDLNTRDFYLQSNLDFIDKHAGSNSYELREATLISAVRWALIDADPSAALMRLSELKGGAARRSLTLRLKLKANRLAKRHTEALDTARLLHKHGAFTDIAALGLLRSLCIACLNDCYDHQQLIQTWQHFSEHERTIPDVAVHAGERMSTLHGDASIALKWIQPVWSMAINRPDDLSQTQHIRLIQCLATLLKTVGADKHWLSVIDNARAQNPKNPLLQYLCAMVCMYNGLWGKAQQMMHEASLRLSTPSLQKSALLTLADLAELRSEEGVAIGYWKKIAYL